MKLEINLQEKKDIFLYTFKLLKQFTTIINISFNPTFMFIQGMDSAHICLYEIKFNKEWFGSYTPPNNNNYISINSNILCNVLTILHDNCDNIILLYSDNNADTLTVENTDKKLQFVLPLCTVEKDDEMVIPETDYDYEWCVLTRTIIKNTLQLSTFGDKVSINCKEDYINLTSTDGITGTMNLTIHADDLKEYLASEDATEYEIVFNLKYINKYCLCANLSQYVKFYVKENIPLKIAYEFDNGYINFMLAPSVDSE
jgi:proliferating cell nuclear antigen PCNA